jgi:hypothetical protein
MNLEEVFKLIDEVPEYREFMTVDELNASSRKLAEKHPDSVQMLEIGQSRAGETIFALKIGNGARNALLFAMPHPNEPIGSMMLEFLSGRLAADESLRKELDYTWYIVKCIDVDGTHLNEGWFKGPFSVTNYARHFYRPPGYQQVEWTFPFDYKTLHFDNPLPETRALMKLIEETRPDFMFSLHNSGFGGVYLYLSDDFKAFYSDFYKLVKSQDLPLHLGEPEVPYVRKYSDAIFGMISTTDSYDFIEENTDKDPAEILKQGGSSYEYACRFGDPTYLVCEMPYFYNPAIHDTTPTDEIRRDVILQNLAAARERFTFSQNQYTKIEDKLTADTPFKESVVNTLRNFIEQLAAQENWAKNDPSLSEKATRAEKFDNLLGTRFYHLLSMGMFLRMLKAQININGADEALTTVMATMEKAFKEEADELEHQMYYHVIPIKKLVSVQLGCALLLCSRAKL